MRFPSLCVGHTRFLNKVGVENPFAMAVGVCGNTHLCDQVIAGWLQGVESPSIIGSCLFSYIFPRRN